MGFVASMLLWSLLLLPFGYNGAANVIRHIGVLGRCSSAQVKRETGLMPVLPPQR